MMPLCFFTGHKREKGNAVNWCIDCQEIVMDSWFVTLYQRFWKSIKSELRYFMEGLGGR